MPKIRLILEDVSEEQAEHLRTELSNIAGVKVTIGMEPPQVVMPELTPEQMKAFEEEWTNDRGHITWMPSPMTNERMAAANEMFRAMDPGPAIGREFIGEIGDEEMPRGQPVLAPGWSQDVNTGMVTDEHGQAQGIPINWRRTISEDDPRHPNQRYAKFEEIVTGAINGCSMENGSNTPDFLLGKFLTDVLRSMDAVMTARAKWYGGDITYWKGRLEAEGAHTEAANAEIERLLERLARNEEDRISRSNCNNGT